MSGRRDLNPGPLPPQGSALARLRYVPRQNSKPYTQYMLTNQLFSARLGGTPSRGLLRGRSSLNLSEHLALPVRANQSLARLRYVPRQSGNGILRYTLRCN